MTNKIRERLSWDADRLGDSFIRAKNIYTSLDPAAQRSALKTLKAKRNRLWCHVILYLSLIHI